MKKGITTFCTTLLALFVAVEASAQGLVRRNATGLPTRPGAAAASTGSAGSEADDSGSAPALNWDAAPVDIVFQAYGEQLDKRNFRKQVSHMDCIEKVGTIDKTESKRGAALYRFNEKEFSKTGIFKL